MPVIGEDDNLYGGKYDEADTTIQPINLVGAQVRYEFIMKELAKKPGPEATRLLQDDISIKIQKLEGLWTQRNAVSAKLRVAAEKLAALKKNKITGTTFDTAKQEASKLQAELLDWEKQRDKLAEGISNYFNDKILPMSREQVKNITRTW